MDGWKDKNVGAGPQAGWTDEMDKRMEGQSSAWGYVIIMYLTDK